MPTIVQNKDKITYMLTEGDLYGRLLTAYELRRKYNGEVIFYLPEITFSHFDRRTAEDIILALKSIAKWMANKKRKSVRFGIQPWHKVHNPDPDLEEYEIPVFKNSTNDEKVSIKKEDGVWIWNISGHKFDNDFVSVVSYVGAIQKLLDIAYGTR